jgi:hypothetical protein
LRDGKGFSNPVTIASATTIDIGGQNSQFVEISGTSTITGLGATYNGPRYLRFTGALLLTHNATTLNLPGGASITTVAGDSCIAVPNIALSGWNVLSFNRAAGGGVDYLNSTRIDVASATTLDLTTNAPNTRNINVTGTTSITGVTVAIGQLYFVRFNAALILTNNANVVTQTGASITTAAGDTCILRATAANTVEVLSYVGVAVSYPTVQGVFKNLQASATGLSAIVSVSADEICVENSSNAYATLRSVSVTPSTAASGANGLDTGTIAISTWYSVWVIWNGATTAGLLSLSATAPTMPSGYTHKARVGWIRTDGTANKYPLGFKQYGRRAQYVSAVGTNLTAIPQMSVGVQGNPTSGPTFVAVAVGNYTPSTAAAISLLLSSNSGVQTIIAAPNNTYGTYVGTANPPPVVINTSGTSQLIWMTLESSSVYWACSGSSGICACMGWEDNI